jgi:hypothetical protein
MHRLNSIVNKLILFGLFAAAAFTAYETQAALLIY